MFALVPLHDVRHGSLTLLASEVHNILEQVSCPRLAFSQTGQGTRVSVASGKDRNPQPHAASAITHLQGLCDARSCTARRAQTAEPRHQLQAAAQVRRQKVQHGRRQNFQGAMRPAQAPLHRISVCRDSRTRRLLWNSFNTHRNITQSHSVAMKLAHCTDREWRRLQGFGICLKTLLQLYQLSPACPAGNCQEPIAS